MPNNPKPATLTPPEPKPPPEPLRAEIVAAAAHIIIAATAIFGVIAFVHSLRVEKKALDVEKKHNAEESIARLYPLDLKINQTLMQYPKARLCLRKDPHGETYKSLEPEDRAVVEVAIEAFGDLFEYYILIRDRIKPRPHGVEIIRSWDAYMEETWKNSFAFRAQVNATQNTWTKMFKDEFKQYAPTPGPESSPSAETPARQSPPKP